LLLYAFATQGWMMYAFTVIYCLGGIAGPALQGIMSGIVPPNAQGELQGGFTSLMSVTSIVGPPLMNNLFAFFTRPEGDTYFPGAAMLLGAIFMVISAVLARSTLKKNLPHQPAPAAPVAH
jgi:DHA1 family tetracycline resistance protein-like MFS transporter